MISTQRVRRRRDLDDDHLGPMVLVLFFPLPRLYSEWGRRCESEICVSKNPLASWRRTRVRSGAQLCAKTELAAVTH